MTTRDDDLRVRPGRIQHSNLGGKRPQDLLPEQPERVIAAAEDEQQGAVHG